jgi:tetratricopeptide (TPR) repeat protein
MMSVMRAIDRASMLARTGRIAQGIDLLKDAATSSPRDRQLLLTLGELCMVADRGKEAEEAFRKSLASKPSSMVCLLLAQIMIRDGRYADAARLLDQGQALDPGDGGIFIVKGDLLKDTGRAPEALAAYRRAMEIDPYRTTAAARARIAELQTNR